MNSCRREWKSLARTCSIRCIGLVVLFLCTLSLPAEAQPSGGPYGPIRQSYPLPVTAGAIYYVAVNGNSMQSGETLSVPTTIEAAMERVKTGDAIVMRGGVYRTGNLLLNQGITIQPYADEQVIIKGTRVASQWENLGNNLWRTKWDRFFPSKPAGWWQREREAKKTPLHRFNNDMVFVNGRFLQSAGEESGVDANSYSIDYESGWLYIGIDPTNHLIEITAHDAALVRTTGECHGKKSDHKGLILRGITFTQYAYRALEVEGTEPEGISEESRFGKDVVGTVLEDCTISYCSRVAGYLRGDHLTIRRCRVHDTSTEGIYVIASNDVVLEQNIFSRNNIENITGYFPAAVKIFNQCHRVTCRNNLVIDLPNSNGIWYDVGNVDGVFVNNWVEGVGHIDATPRTDQLWPSDNGFFFEISKGAVCAGNVFVNCDHGVMILNSSNVRIYQNTFVNSMACIGRNGRTAAADHFGWHPSTGPDLDKRDGHVFINNLLTGDEKFTRSLFFVWQPAALCEQLAKPQLSQLDNNAYIRRTIEMQFPMILWSPGTGKDCQSGFDSPQSLHGHYAQFSAHSVSSEHYNGPLFVSDELKHFQLMKEFSGALVGTKLPAEVKTLLERSNNEIPYVGAYPPQP